MGYHGTLRAYNFCYYHLRVRVNHAINLAIFHDLRHVFLLIHHLGFNGHNDRSSINCSDLQEFVPSELRLVVEQFLPGCLRRNLHVPLLNLLLVHQRGVQLIERRLHLLPVHEFDLKLFRHDVRLNLHSRQLPVCRAHLQHLFERRIHKVLKPFSLQLDYWYLSL